MNKKRAGKAPAVSVKERKKYRKLAAFWSWSTKPVVLASIAGVLASVAIVLCTLALNAGSDDTTSDWVSAFGTVFGAVITGGALLVAALSYRRQVADRHQELVNQRKAQAVSVTVGSRTDEIPEVRARTASISGYFAERKKHSYYIRNDSQLAIYKVELYIDLTTHSTSVRRDVMAPGDEESTEMPVASLRAYARFTDSAGVTWRRDSSGKLTELYDATTVLNW